MQDQIAAEVARLVDERLAEKEAADKASPSADVLPAQQTPVGGTAEQADAEADEAARLAAEQAAAEAVEVEAAEKMAADKLAAETAAGAASAPAAKGTASATTPATPAAPAGAASAPAASTPAATTPAAPPPAVKKAYKVGETGPGGGIVFAADGYSYKEMVNLGSQPFKDITISGGQHCTATSATVKKYRGGGYSDWYLPKLDEMRQIYANLPQSERGKLGSGWYVANDRGLPIATIAGNPAKRGVQEIPGFPGYFMYYAGVFDDYIETFRFSDGKSNRPRPFDDSYQILAVRKYSAAAQKTYKKGSVGPGGGEIIAADGASYREYVRLGTYRESEVAAVVQKYRGGGLSGWSLFTEEGILAWMLDMYSSGGYFGDPTWVSNGKGGLTLIDNEVLIFGRATRFLMNVSLIATVREPNSYSVGEFIGKVTSGMFVFAADSESYQVMIYPGMTVANLDEAKSYLKDCIDHKLQGFEDWRLPTKEDLENFYQNFYKTKKIVREAPNYSLSSTTDSAGRPFIMNFRDNKSEYFDGVPKFDVLVERTYLAY
jgi:hypothetical protein